MCLSHLLLSFVIQVSFYYFLIDINSDHQFVNHVHIYIVSPLCTYSFGSFSFVISQPTFSLYSYRHLWILFISASRSGSVTFGTFVL